MLLNPHLFVAAALLTGVPVGAQSPATPTTALTVAPGHAPPDHPRLGTARLRYWGFDVYDMTLLAPPGFDIQRFEDQAFSLELRYLRAFKSADIATRSIDEMQDIAPIEPAQAKRWRDAMGALFPDVQRGDRITGVHTPGHGARFYLNGRWIGDIADDAFSRRFFGIWLSPKTSQPRLREALIQSMSGPPRTP
ncbi:chalcone isomerase family protein [Hydrogenophaga laconesensis]|uniref:Chalcone isomerase domain-containing protein n=1 Tax=Hydrogenophaga laconesensis TaxID=1805971 RepID=A0ABU1VCQ2_9BURK|nr:chalcone isomerase family protein [Hydrogenophaga laconesensis]MDR7095244.1 hypothetical protein [Hydrogenophaga laconesensis]